MAQSGFLAAMKNYFGLHKGQTPMEFGKEVMALSYEEKCQFHEMLKDQAGIDCLPPSEPTKKA